MTIELTLGSGEYIPHHRIITLPQKEINLVFNSPLFAKETFIVELENARKKEQKRIAVGEPINIADYCDTAGEVSITVMLEINGTRAKQWTVEPFIVQELPTGKVAYSELEEIKKNNELLKKAIIELRKEIKK